MVSSPEGVSPSDSGDCFQDDCYRCSPQESDKIQTLIGATQQMIKEEESGLQLHKDTADAPLGLANGPPKDSGPRSTRVYTQSSLPLESVLCQNLGQMISPAPFPAPLSRLNSPKHLHNPKDHTHTELSPFSLSLHPPFGRAGTCSASPSMAPPLYPSHSLSRPYLDKHRAYSLTGYTLDHLYDPESLHGYYTSASTGPTHYNMTPHLRIPTVQTSGHKGTSVIITNSS